MSWWTKEGKCWTELDEALYGSVAWVRKAFQVSSTVGTTMLARAKNSTSARPSVNFRRHEISYATLGRLRLAW